MFNAAVSSIKVKVYDSDSVSDAFIPVLSIFLICVQEHTESPTPILTLQKTKTGIISNRRPVTGTPALSGTATPGSEPSSSGTSTPRLSVMAAAK